MNQLKILKRLLALAGAIALWLFADPSLRSLQWGAMVAGFGVAIILFAKYASNVPAFAPDRDGLLLRSELALWFALLVVCANSEATLWLTAILFLAIVASRVKLLPQWFYGLNAVSTPRDPLVFVIAMMLATGAMLKFPEFRREIRYGLATLGAAILVAGLARNWRILVKKTV